MRLIDSVNWHADSISRFESAVGVLQRFCTLNAVGFEAFFTFAEEAGAMTGPGSSDIAVALERLDIRRLGKVLRVSRELDQSGIEHFYPPIGYEKGVFYRHFRYCRSCIQRGYHTLAHQVEWLDRCLIHNELLSKQCPKCGKDLGFGKYQHNTLLRFRCRLCGEPLWPGVNNRPWPKPMTIEELGPVADYVAWTAKWHAHPRFYALQSIKDLAGEIGSAERIDHLKSVISRPMATARAWRRTTSTFKREQHFPMARQKAALILGVLKSLGPRTLIGFLGGRWVDPDGVVRLDQLALAFARRLGRCHATCAAEINRAKDLAGVYQFDFQFHLASLCFPCALAQEIRRQFQSRPEDNRWQCYAGYQTQEWLGKWLISVGLMRPGTALGSSASPRGIVDADLVRVLNHYMKVHLCSMAEGYLHRYEDAERLTNLRLRAQAVYDGWMSYERGAVILPFIEGRGLVIRSWGDAVGHRLRQQALVHDASHNLTVATRAASLRDVILHWRDGAREELVRAINRLPRH